jgi:antibiotic biosynthesis monooxygenase (ABM) superfamily enzyme
MDASAPDSPRPPLEVRGARASTVIVHRVPPDSVERFLAWQRGITGSAEASPGYQATEIYPPADPKQPEWVVVIHFDNSEALQRWLASPARAEWTARLPAEIADFRLKTLSGGFGPWFAGLVADGGLPPPPWKMALTVLFALYPTVMLLNFFLSPFTLPLFGLAVAMLIGNAASVSFLEWLAMPVIRRLLGPWLRANGKEGRVVSLVGLILILAALTLMTFLFSLMTPRP